MQELYSPTHDRQDKHHPVQAVYRLSPYGTSQDEPPVAWLIDSTAISAEVVQDPERRCFSFYEALITKMPEAPLLLWPPANAHASRTADLLASPAFFRSFLCAALRAYAIRPLALILPAIEGEEEILSARRALLLAAGELYDRGEEPDEAMPIGICLDTADALRDTRRLLECADLLVIDIDAISHTVSGLMPLLQLIENAVGNARALNRSTVLRGALATDPRVVPHLLSMGAHAVSGPLEIPVEISKKNTRKSSCKYL